MNIILFESRELGRPLPRRDERTIHLLKVLHKKPGDTFEAGLLGGGLGHGRIESIRLDGALIFSLDLKNDPPPRAPIRAAVGFPRPIQLRRLLRDLSSLGIEAVDLMGTELGEKSYRDTRLLTGGGARAALIEGAAQARDTSIPALTVYPSLEAWLTGRPWEEKDRRIRIRQGPFLVALDNVRPEGSFVRFPALGRPITLAVGPERGWSDRERDLLERAGFIRLSMGNRALRTETACTAAVVLALEKSGELG
ncbi:MAG: RsmE family RNA methyltransferase [Treponema sp.]|nr:RsmE family RNA methyltransferase [Treponema sp.]